MYGAIFGDIIGSRFEFDRGGKTKDFELFTAEDDWTDDTAMTIAIGEALLRAGKQASVEEIRENVTEAMRDWGHRYPGAGYGGRFYDWLFFSKHPRPYNSFGNGSAMRVSAAGWLYDSLERTMEVARATAEVTHNHPEGIKGAECTAAVMYLARTGADKEEIKAYVVRTFGYDLSKSVDELRRCHKHVETCQDSMPKALVSFFEGTSYEDVVRNAVSLGGDTDTLGAIAGAMAEACYGMPVAIMAEGLSYLPEDMMEVLRNFDRALGRREAGEPSDAYENNQYIKTVVAEIYEEKTVEKYMQLLAVLVKRMEEEGEVPTPMVDVNHVLSGVDSGTLMAGGEFSLPQDLRLIKDTMQDNEGKQWFPLFTDEVELHRGETTNVIVNAPIANILTDGLASERVAGVVINPFGQSLTLDKEILRIMLPDVEPGADGKE